MADCYNEYSARVVPTNIHFDGGGYGMFIGVKAVFKYAIRYIDDYVVVNF